MERQLRGGKIVRGKPDRDSGPQDPGERTERVLEEMVANSQIQRDRREQDYSPTDWDQSKFCNYVCQTIWNGKSASEFRIWDPCTLCPLLCEESEE